MQKIFVFIILGLFLLSGIGAAALHDTNITTEPVTVQTKLQRSPIRIQQSDNQEMVSIQLDETNTFLSNPGKPLLPKIVKTFELPFGVKDITISVESKERSVQYIDSLVKPSNFMIPLAVNSDTSLTNLKKMDTSVYNANKLYPESTYETKIGCGLNKDLDHVTFVTVEWYPVRYNPMTDKVVSYESADIDISYIPSDESIFAETASQDLVIISPSEFSEALQPLVTHKNNLDIKTTLKTVEDIYAEYDGYDEAEQIKYFIKDALETWDISYVLLVGGLKSVIHAKPRDNCNLGSSGWYLPVRYTNMYDDPAFPLASGIHDPGVISDLYYADVYKEGGEFADWDPNGDKVFLALGKPGVEDDENIDFYPDVSLSRLACRSIEEVNTVVNKIITYESSFIDPSWFEKMIVVSGDGFLDQEDLNIKWDTKEIDDGTYTIYAQSHNPDEEYGPIVSVTVTKDSSSESVITYSHDDHLIPEVSEALENGFPTVPIAEIVSISEGDVLGNTDVSFDPASKDYCNEFYFWANVSYVDEVLTIRGKSYDPKPYGN
ncbi:MAG: peptidase C25, partial [Candidatus Thermoplasmatota archaeon]|nr:peptidase C25 [Candidatus Thermoplasmatota archaeon]